MAGFSGVKRRFQLTGTWNGVAIYDDYGHHPVEIAAVLKAARAGARGRVIAVVEPHRYTRVRDLFDEFAACFKDADSVIVTPLYSAGEPPIDGIDHVVAGRGDPRHRASRPSRPSTASARSRRCSKRFAASGDMVVCLGAGNSTEWAHALPDWLAGEPMRAGGRRVSFPDLLPELAARMPDLRGRLAANAMLADITWFRVGGPAQVLFTPADEADLAYFLARLPAELPVIVIGLGSNLLVRDGGVPGVVIRLGPRLLADRPSSPATACAPARPCPTSSSRAPRRMPASPGLAFYRGIPGSIGGALRMNAGAHGRETKDVLVEARAVDRQGNIHVLSLAATWSSPIATAACPATGSSPRRCTRARPAIRPRS